MAVRLVGARTDLGRAEITGQVVTALGNSVVHTETARVSPAKNNPPRHIVQVGLWRSWRAGAASGKYRKMLVAS